MIKVETKICKMCTLEDKCLVVSTLGGLYVASCIFNTMCNCFVFFVGINALFLVPLVYKFQKAKIDETCQLVGELGYNLFKTVESRIPRYTDKSNVIKIILNN